MQKKSSPSCPCPRASKGSKSPGAGYINARLHRATAAQELATEPAVEIDDHAGEGAADVQGKILVEHTSINPNKAAHIGHLRNAILGDTFVRLLRSAGHTVDIQNYIDNTGVQVADVVVGFTQLEKQSQSADRGLNRLYSALRLSLLGPLCPRLAVVRARQRKP